MTKKEMYETIERLKEQYAEEYFFIGLRFEDKEREVGEIITDRSRHNSDREDEREFPEFDSEEYEELYELDGVSAWDISNDDSQYKYRPHEADQPARKGYIAKHCYFLASDHAASHSDLDLDYNEIVLQNAEVIAMLF